jgi:hypothetical protein
VPAELFGQYLVRSGLVRPDQLDAALSAQRGTTDTIGVTLARLGAAPQRAIDAAWIEFEVRPLVDEAIDRASGNRWSRLPDHRVEFTRVRRHDQVICDMLAGAAPVAAESEIRGEAVLHASGRASLPVRFSIERGSPVALLDDASESVCRRWVPLIERLSGPSAAPAA